MNGRDGVDELHFEQLDGRHLGQQQPPGVAPAQIDLLQILIEPAFGKQRPRRESISSGSSGTCDSCAAWVRPGQRRTDSSARIRRRHQASASGSCDSRASPSYSRQELSHRARHMSRSAAVSPSIMCA